MAEGQEIERFEIGQDADEAAEVSEFGPWVRYSDHQAALERVQLRLETAEAGDKRRLLDEHEAKVAADVERIAADEARHLHEDLRRKAEARAQAAEAERDRAIEYAEAFCAEKRAAEQALEEVRQALRQIARGREATFDAPDGSALFSPYRARVAQRIARAALAHGEQENA